MLKNSLFLVGEIGGNDFNYAFAARKTLDEIMDMMPDVVQSIMNAVTVSFFSVFFFGCVSLFLFPLKPNFKCVLNFTNLHIFTHDFSKSY